MSNKQPPSVTVEAGVPSQERPGIEAAMTLSAAIPNEEPRSHPSPAPDGSEFLGAVPVHAGAEAQAQQADADCQVQIGKLAAAETPAAYDAAADRSAAARRLRDADVRLIELLQTWCAARLDRTRSTTGKVIVIYVLFALGEVALNAATAVSIGEPPSLAVVSFLGLAAASVGAGWVVGSKVRDAVDRHAAGVVPPQLEASGLEALFRPASRSRFDSVPIDLWGWFAGLLAVAVTSGILVANLRVEAGMSPLWGPVSSALVLVAAAPPYLLRNRAADMYESAQERIKARNGEIDLAALTMDHHTSAQQSTNAARAARPHAVNAAYLAAISGGYAQIATKQAHLVGHWADRETLPVAATQYIIQHTHDDVQPSGTTTPMTDHQQRRASEKRDQPSRPTDSQPTVVTDSPSVADAQIWDAVSSGTADFTANHAASSNGGGSR